MRQSLAARLSFDYHKVWQFGFHICVIAPLALRAYLLDYLPSYMIPSYFVHLEKMPLTKNGKLDERLLVLTTDVITANQVPYEAPANEIEHQLVKLWQETLQRTIVAWKVHFRDCFYSRNAIRI